MVAGDTTSFTSGGIDTVLAKYSANGTEQWSKTWGGSGTDTASDVIRVADDGFVTVGDTASYGAGSNDQTLVKYTPDGEVLNCTTACSSLTTNEVDHALAEMDYSMTEGNVVITEGDVAVTEVDQTASTTETVVVSAAPWLSGSVVPAGSLALNSTLLDNPARNSAYRLRFLHHVTGKAADANTLSLKLQAAPKVGACDTSFFGEVYSDVTSSSALKYYTENSTGDGAGIDAHPNDPSHSGHTNVLQTYETANNFSNINAISVGQDGLWDFALYVDDAILGGSFCLRVVNSDGSPLASYSSIPEIYIPPKVSQQLRHGKFFSAGEELQSFKWRR